MYDSACETLAEHFLQDEKGVTKEMIAQLAQHIQTSIEDWLGYDLKKLQEARKKPGDENVA